MKYALRKRKNRKEKSELNADEKQPVNQRNLRMMVAYTPLILMVVI